MPSDAKLNRKIGSLLRRLARDQYQLWQTTLDNAHLEKTQVRGHCVAGVHAHHVVVVAAVGVAVGVGVGWQVCVCGGGESPGPTLHVARVIVRDTLPWNTYAASLPSRAVTS